MKKSLTIEGQKYILASSLLAEHQLRVLKHQETFAVFDCHGDVFNAGHGEEGLYYEGTRFLSQLEFSLGRARPLLLSSTITDNNLLFCVDLTNPDLETSDQGLIPRGSLHILRSLFIYENACYEQLSITNFTGKPLSLPLSYRFAADFADIFEIRGQKREGRGQLGSAEFVHNELVIPYLGLDQIKRQTRIVIEPPPSQPLGGAERNCYSEIFTLESQETRHYLLSYHCEVASQAATADQRQTKSFHKAYEAWESNFKHWKQLNCPIDTSHKQFNHWINRSYSDLFMLSSQTEYGLYPYAGVPWFSTTFGRDGLITALETLWVNPDLAQGVLAFLAATQAEAYDPASDAEPGKILHEARKGEMANLGEIPFAKYYGSIDATPLFIILAGKYYQFTGNLSFIRSLWPSIERALSWIDEYGDSDHDGYVEYNRHSQNGLINQGWKDSFDSVFHGDGSDALAPIALCEVQAYVYEAKCLAAELALALEQPTQAKSLAVQAQNLKEQFNRDFWCEDLGTYALALDRYKKPCQVRSSNAGHCLFSGIASKELAVKLAATLMSPKHFSGWGIRTIAEEEARYNPMSYHNGSIWPHDTAMIAFGLAKYGHKGAVNQIFAAMFDAAVVFDLYRLPELFCGFGRSGQRAPVHYPMSCAPQAWAAGAAFFLLQACLGLEIDGAKKRLSFTSPDLPKLLRYLRIHGLKVGPNQVDLEIIRHPNGDVGIHQLAGQGEVEIHIHS